MPVAQQWPVKTSATNAVTENHTGPATTQGNTLVVIDVCRDNASTSTSVTDNGGNTWVLGPVMVDPSTSACQRLLYCVDANPVTQVQVHTYGADGVNGPADAGHSAIVFELEGVLGIADAASLLSPNVQTSATTTGPSVTPPAGGALVIGTLSAGVTNRTFTPVDDGKGWASLNPIAISQMRLSSRWVEVTEQTAIAPAWTLASGSATTVGHLTVAFALDPNYGGPLAVDVGADRTVSVGSVVDLTATVSGGEGTRTYSWTIQSGPAGGAQVLSDSAPSTAFDPSGVPGVYVLRCTVTDSSGSAHDEVTITVLRNLTFMPVAAVNASTGWTPTPGGSSVLTVLSDSDDGTYITSSDDPNGQILDVQLPPLAVPDQPFQLRLRARRGGSATSATVTARLYTGATLRATSSAVQIPDDTYGQVDITFALSALTGISESDWQAGVRATLAFTAA